MMKNKLAPCMMLPVLLLMISCGHTTDPSAEKAVVKTTVQQLYRSFETKNMELMSDVMAHDEDMVNFGTGLNEHELGWQQWKDAHLAQFKAFDAAHINSKDLTAFTSPSGDVAWFADITDWVIMVGNDSMNINNVRITGVLNKRDDAWKIVQIHASVPQVAAE